MAGRDKAKDEARRNIARATALYDWIMWSGRAPSHEECIEHIRAQLAKAERRGAARERRRKGEGR